MADEGCAWPHTPPGDLYRCLLTPDEGQRREALREVIETLKEVSQGAMWAGESSMLEFVTNHGPQIVTYARCCPFDDIASAFSELLLWIRRSCLLDVEDMLDDSDSLASSEGDPDHNSQPPQPLPAHGDGPPPAVPLDLAVDVSEDSLLVPAKRVKSSSVRRRVSPHWSASSHLDPTGTLGARCASGEDAEASDEWGVLTPQSQQGGAPSGPVRSTPPSAFPRRAPPSDSDVPALHPSPLPHVTTPPHNGVAAPGAAPRRPLHLPAASRDFGERPNGVANGAASAAPAGRSRPKDWSERPCATFIPLDCVEPLLTDEPKARALYEHAFLSEGEVSNFVRVLSIKPELGLIMLRGWGRTMASGPLTQDVGWYVALSTASLCECEYWVARCEMNFYRAGGNPAWVAQGMAAAPAKVAGFASFNMKLTLWPWTLEKADVDALVQGCGWTLPELVQAIVISSQMLNFCSIVRGAGVLLDGTRSAPAAPAETESRPILVPGQKVEAPDVRPPPSAGSSPAPSHSGCNSPVTAASDDGRTDMLKALEKTGEPFPEDPPSSFLETFNKIVDNDMNEEEKEAQKEDDCPGPCRYAMVSGNTERRRFDGFRQREDDKEAPYLRLSEYNWKDDASCVVDQLLSDRLSAFLDDNFMTVTTMTDNDIFGCIKGYDTSNLRRMVWYYVLGIYGIVTDEHNYRAINILVGIQQPGIIGLKKYIKNVGAFCGRITHAEYHFDRRQYTKPFSHKDKLHMTLLASAARMQAALIYGMRMTSKYIAGE
eukprot:TRINITY_DN18251_c0_g1_i1.p1 TRINITY_DN18251_c0_g1~~TRINITY_DN18251_c0_g1_i1.p1  ORF type:complete len:770 (+),score=264.52 TRINITY_DN18251_c0_g1_i1:50-2359(+)